MDGPQPEARAILMKGKKGRGSAIQEVLVEYFFFFYHAFSFSEVLHKNGYDCKAGDVWPTVSLTLKFIPTLHMNGRNGIIEYNLL